MSRSDALTRAHVCARCEGRGEVEARTVAGVWLPCPDCVHGWARQYEIERLRAEIVEPEPRDWLRLLHWLAIAVLVVIGVIGWLR